MSKFIIRRDEGNCKITFSVLLYFQFQHLLKDDLNTCTTKFPRLPYMFSNLHTIVPIFKCFYLTITKKIYAPYGCIQPCPWNFSYDYFEVKYIIVVRYVFPHCDALVFPLQFWCYHILLNHSNWFVKYSTLQ